MTQLGSCQHDHEGIPSPPSTVFLKDGRSADFTSWLDQWLPDNPYGLQENPPVSSWPTFFLAPDPDKQSYRGSLDAQIAERLELDALLAGNDVWLSDLWWNAVAEVSLKYTPSGNPAPQSGGKHCKNVHQHSSWDSNNEVFEISRTDFQALSRRKNHPQAPSKQLKSTRKGHQRANITLGKMATSPKRLGRSLPSTNKSIKYVRLEEVADENDRYKWNRRAGGNGSWENSKKEPVDVMVLLRDAKAQLKMKVRPGGTKLPVDMSWSHADTCFKGEVQNVGMLRVSEGIMNEMCKNPQRKEGFEARTCTKDSCSD